MPLTEVKIKNKKPDKKTSKLFDGGGLYLEISPKGGKWWRFKYRYAGKEKRLSLGVYPDVSLKMARERKDDCRRLLADDVDPSEHRKATKAAREESASNTFEVIAREWHSRNCDSWTQGHAARILRRLEKDIFPWLGKKPVVEIKPKDVLRCVQRLEDRGVLETAHRALQTCGQIFRYAVITGRVERSPTADLKGALAPVKTKHLAAVTDPVQVGELLRTIDGYKGSFIVACALKLAPLVFVRPGELRRAKWEDIDLKTREWRYLVTKTNTQHIVPLSKQALSVLKSIEPVTGNSVFVFPSARSFARPMSENAILAAFRRMGIEKNEMTGHGFRAMARTMLDEILGFRPDLIEHQLAHAVKDPNGRAYNRTTHLPQRRKMMQSWADYLDDLERGAEVIYTFCAR